MDLRIWQRQRRYGKEQDALTSLSYYGARYFDPLSLTWTQADPIARFAPDAAWDEPRRANLYAFTLNNPLAMVDPDGRWPRPPGGRMGPSGDNSGETIKKGAVLLVNRTASLVASIPVVPPKIRLAAAIVAAATSESGPPVDLANVDPASLPGPPGGPGAGPPGPRGSRPSASADPGTKKTSQIDRKAFAKERAQYWKDEAKNNPGKYSKEDLARMEKGRAPTGPDGHPMELHHKDQKPDEVQPMSRTDHRLGENYKKNHPPKTE
jgi:RHS repeat-associated protein